MIEYDHEPIRGLPGDLPEGETILWQGSPDWRTFMRTALYSRWIMGYFALLAAWALANGSLGGAAASVIACVGTLGLLAGFAMLVEKTTVYTITNRRVVLRIGIALNKCINLPLKLIGAAELRPQAAGHGDIALVPTSKHGLGYAVLWPHARPFKLRDVQPMLRAVPDAQRVASLLAQACAALVPNVPGEEAAASANSRAKRRLEEAHA